MNLIAKSTHARRLFFNCKARSSYGIDLRVIVYKANFSTPGVVRFRRDYALAFDRMSQVAALL